MGIFEISVFEAEVSLPLGVSVGRENFAVVCGLRISKNDSKSAGFRSNAGLLLSVLIAGVA